MENQCQNISSSDNDTIWIKSEVPNEFDSTNEDLYYSEEISVKAEHENEMESTSFYPKIEDDGEPNSQEEEKTSKQIPFEKTLVRLQFL